MGSNLAPCPQHGRPRQVHARPALCLQSRRPVGVTARLRHGGANRQRHDDTAGGVHPDCTGYLMAFGAMVALARRMREGGSWLVRICLAQVGKWIVDLGEVPPAALKGIPAEFIAGELELGR